MNDYENMETTPSSIVDFLDSSEDSVQDTEFSPETFQTVSSENTVLTPEQIDHIISSLDVIASRDYTEQINHVGYTNDIIVEHSMLQSDYLGYLGGFSLFLVIVVLASYIYKFFKIFF